MSEEEFEMIKKQEIIEKFIIAPSTHLFFGVTVDKNTDIEDDITLPNNEGKIHQKIKDLVLTTVVNRTTNECNIDTKEETILNQKLVSGMKLIWGEDTGYIIPPYKMRTVDEAIEDLEAIKGV